MRLCKNCGTLIESDVELCPVCHCEIIKEDKVEEETPAVQKININELPPQYKRACMEADIGVTWAKLLSNGIFLYGGIVWLMSGILFCIDPDKRSDSSFSIICISIFIRAEVSLIAAYVIIQRKKYAGKVVVISGITSLVLVSLLVIAHVFDVGTMIVIDFPLLVATWINRKYFKERESVFIYD